MTFDHTKPVQTRDGRKARILDTNLNNEAGSLVAAVIDSGQQFEFVIICQKDGRASYQTTDTEDDLINIPEKRWVNLYQNEGDTCYHTSREDADHRASKEQKRVACIPFTEGDGL